MLHRLIKGATLVKLALQAAGCDSIPSVAMHGRRIEAGKSWVESQRWILREIVAQLGEFDFESAAQDGPAAPRFRVEVLIVIMEAGGVAFALPLVATPQSEEAVGPLAQLGGLDVGELHAHDLEDIHRTLFVSDGSTLDGIEQRVGHEIVFVGLGLIRGTKLGRGLLNVDGPERRDGEGLGADEWSFSFHPTQPLAQPCLVDAGNWGEPAAGVTVHGGVTNSGFTAIAGGEKQGTVDVREHPDAGGANACLDVLQRDVVGFPFQLSSQGVFDGGNVGLMDRADIEFVVMGTEGFRDIEGGLFGDRATVVGRLIGGRQQLPNKLAVVAIGEDVQLPTRRRKDLNEAVDSEFVDGEFDH